MNICIITSSFPSGPDDIAQAPFLVDFILGLIKRRHQVALFTQDREGSKETFLEGVRVKWYPWMKSKKPLVQLNPMNPFDSLRIVNLLYNGKRALLPFLKENKIHACLALWVLPGGYFANCGFRSSGIPYSLWALGSDIYRYGKNPFLYPMMKRIVREAKSVFADGFDLSRKVEERFGRKCSFLATTRTIPSRPPSLESVRRETEGREGGFMAGPYRFLFVGRLEKVKGIDLLLQSMALLIEEAKDVHLTIVGKGSLEMWAKNFIHQKGLEKWITLKGNVEDQTLASLYASSHCVVIPSRSESIPLVFSEALNFNKDLIVTDVGDMGRMGHQYGVAGVIPPEDPVSLKEMMKKKVLSQHKDGIINGKVTLGIDEKRAELKQLFNIETSVERFLEDYV